MQTSACDLLFSYSFSNRQMPLEGHLTILTLAYGKSLTILHLRPAACAWLITRTRAHINYWFILLLFFIQFCQSSNAPSRGI